MNRADSWRRWYALPGLAPVAAVALVVLALGPPFTGWIDFAICLAALLGLVLGSLREFSRRWGFAGAAMAVAVVVRIGVPAGEIHEGHNVFIGNAPNSVFARGLPPAVYKYLETHAAVRQGRDRVAADNRLYAFSTDAVLDNPRYSRTVSSIGFASRYQLRLGAFNEIRYNLYGANRPSRAALPYFVFYEFDPAFAGSELCWRGNLFVEDAAGAFEHLQAKARRCRMLAPVGADGRLPRLYGAEADPATPLAMSLSPPLGVTVLRGLRDGGGIAAVIAILLLLIRLPREPVSRFWYAGGAVAVTLISAAIYLPDFRAGFFVYQGGNDGLTYVSMARAMLAALNGGDVAGFLRGGADIFYFMPGQRYFQAVQMLLFGETLLGYLLIVCFLPLVLLWLMRDFLPEKLVRVLFVCFLFVPVFEAFGFLQFYLVKLLLRGFGEPAAYMMFMGALCLTLPVFREIRVAGRMLCLAAGFLAVAVAIRPNLVPGAGILLLAASYTLLRERRFPAFAALCIGFTPVLLVPLHNIWFGGEFVPLTKAADIVENLQAAPSDYLRAAGDLATLSFPSAAIQKVGHHWWGVIKPYEFWYMLALVAVIWSAFARWTERPVRVLAWVVIAQYGVFLFYIAGGRYGHLTWTLSLLIFFEIMHRRVVPAWRARSAAKA